MIVLVECNECKEVTKVDASNIIDTIIGCSENKSIFSGFLCNECSKVLDEEN